MSRKAAMTGPAYMVVADGIRRIEDAAIRKAVARSLRQIFSRAIAVLRPAELVSGHRRPGEPEIGGASVKMKCRKLTKAEAVAESAKALAAHAALVERFNASRK